MKRTWTVRIEQGIGHEYHNTISESDWFGPYTANEADQIADELNGLFATEPGREKRMATAMPLTQMSRKQLVRMMTGDVAEMIANPPED